MVPEQIALILELTITNLHLQVLVYMYASICRLKKWVEFRNVIKMFLAKSRNLRRLRQRSPNDGRRDFAAEPVPRR